MSIKRYNISGLHPHIIESKDGFMVYYEDYARLKAFSDEAQAHIAKEERKSRERLDMEQAENARLKAEVERLTKAGNAMASSIQFNEEMSQDYNGPTIVHQCVQCWNAAKEGKQSK
jgi:hypothetical protein